MSDMAAALRCQLPTVRPLALNAPLPSPDARPCAFARAPSHGDPGSPERASGLPTRRPSRRARRAPRRSVLRQIDSPCGWVKFVESFPFQTVGRSASRPQKSAKIGNKSNIKGIVCVHIPVSRISQLATKTLSSRYRSARLAGLT
jgi:hypothetical protein